MFSRPTLIFFQLISGCSDQHGAARAAKDAVQQDQDDRHLRAAERGHPPHPQQGVHVISLQERHARGLTRAISVQYSNQGPYHYPL